MSLDAQINFGTYVAGSVAKPSAVNGTFFYARWTGYIVPTVSGKHTIGTNSDAGVNLFINDTPLIQALSSIITANITASFNNSAVIELTAGVPYPITLEWQHGAGANYECQLLWVQPGGSIQVIPSANLSTSKASVTGNLTGAWWNGTAGLWFPSGPGIIDFSNANSPNKNISNVAGTLSDNLIKNGDFDQGLANWAASDAWGGNVSAVSVVNSSSFPRGAFVLQANDINQDPESVEYVPLDITKTYFLEGWVSISAPLTSGACYLGLQEYDGNKASLGHGTSGALWALFSGLVSTAGNTFQYFSVELSGSSASPSLTQFNSAAKFVRLQGLLNWSTTAGQQKTIQVQGLRLSEVAAGHTRALKLLQKGISSDLNTQGSVPPAALTRNPFTTLSYDDTLGTGAGVKISWPAITIYNPDGTTIVVPSSTDSTQIATVPTPTLTTVAGGSKGARTYFVRVAYMIDGGIRGFSPEVSIAVAANSLLKLVSPASAPPWDHYSLFVSTATGTETWVSQVGSDVGVPFGTDWVEPTAALAVNGPRYSSMVAKGIDGFVKAAAPYNFSLFFYPYWDILLSIVRFYSGANLGSGLVAGSVSTPDNVRGMSLDKHIPLASAGIQFTTITVAQGGAGTTTGGPGNGGCPLVGTRIIPLGSSAFSTKETNSKWIEIELKNGYTLTATPDHPVYTDRGKVQLRRLKLGEEVITDCGMVPLVRKTRPTFTAEKDVVSMPSGHLYYANGILSHNFKLPQS